MRVELLKDGSPDCPLVILWGGNATELDELAVVLTGLAAGDRESVGLSELSGFSGFPLTVLVGQAEGITKSNPTTCSLPAEMWSQVVERLVAFRDAEGERHQWLDEHGAISLLLSTHRRW